MITFEIIPPKGEQIIGTPDIFGLSCISEPHERYQSTIMKKRLFAITAFLLFSSHDMYLKLDTYFLEPNTEASIQLFNGTFDKSDNVIDRKRMIDMSLTGNGERSQVNASQWSEKDSVTLLDFTTGEPGTWVAGISTAARSIEMQAEDFNTYLEHDGVLDILDFRRDNDELENNAVEQYAKHVKAIFQVGDKRTDDWQTALGYPVEFVPLNNPYDLNTGDELQVKLLANGEPLADQLVYVDYRATVEGHSHENGEGHSHSHDAEEDHQHTSGSKLRTDDNGIVNVKLEADGIWYLRTINLVKSEAPDLTHESNWATLTFEVTHGHGEDTHSHGEDTHTHEEAADNGIPSYVFWIGSFVLLGGLFFWFNRKK